MNRWIGLGLLLAPLGVWLAIILSLMATGVSLAVVGLIMVGGLGFPLTIGCLFSAHKRTAPLMCVAATLLLWIGLSFPIAKSVPYIHTEQVIRRSAPTLLGYLAASLLVTWAGTRLCTRTANQPLKQRWMYAVLLAINIGVLGFGIYLRSLGLLPIARGSRREAFERLWNNLERFYSHWDTSPVPPAELKARYLPHIIAADRTCQGQPGPCEPYREALRNMLAELQDGHTSLYPSPPLAAPPLAVRHVEGKAAIAWVMPGSEAEAAGLQPGMFIVSVEGQPVEEALRRVPRWAIAYTAPHTREYNAYRYLLAGPPNTPVTFTVQNSQGQQHTLTLMRKKLAITPPPPVEGFLRDDGLAYIAVRTLRTSEVVKSFDKLLDSMLDAPGLILDLRNNGGGNSAFGDQIVGRLITEPITYGEECFRARHPMHLWAIGCQKMVVKPRSQSYTGPIAVLLNTNVHSSAEWMAAALCTTGRAHCFGRTTAGDSGNPVLFFVPDATIRFSTGNFRLVDGTPLNGTGIKPHEEIEWTLEDLRQGRDPDLEAARAWLLR